jgi:hypothetical protein
MALALPHALVMAPHLSPRTIRARAAAVIATIAIVAPAPFVRVDVVRAAWKPVAAFLASTTKETASRQPAAQARACRGSTR